MDTKIRVPNFSGILTNEKSVLSLYHYHSNKNNSNYTENRLESCLGTIEATTTTTTTVPMKTITSATTTISTPPVTAAAVASCTGTINVIPRSSSTSSSSSSSSIKSTSLNGTIGSSHNSFIPSDILDDLASRFIINVPVDERNNLIRICFQIELAHWFYLDFFCSVEEKKLMPCGMKQFAMLLFQHIPFLRAHLSGIDKILEDWKEYKLSVPTYGAILISEDLKHVLLVQSYWAKSSWGFPKGKVNEHEDPVHCAAREVFEETGYDISELIVPNDYIEAVINYQYTRLYLVRNVPLETIFAPRTRKEIKCIEWFPVDSLPINKNDIISKQNLGINANSFFMIMPFIKRLKKWVQDNRLVGGIKIKSSSPILSSTGISATTSTITTTGSGTGTKTMLSSPIVCYNDSNAVVATNGYGGNSNNTNSTIITPTFVNLSSIQNGIIRKSNKDSKLSQNNIMSALNISKSSYKQNNNNNNNISNCKRQRHKSMGDIDGIKLNFNVYNANYYYYNSNNNMFSSKYYYNSNSTKFNTNQILNKQQQFTTTTATAKMINSSITTGASTSITAMAIETTTVTANLPSSINDSLSSSSSIISTSSNNSISSISSTSSSSSPPLSSDTVATMTTTTTAANNGNNSYSNNNNKREKYNKTNFINKRHHSYNNSNNNNNNTSSTNVINNNSNNNGTGNLKNNNSTSNINNLINSNTNNNKNGMKNSNHNILLNNVRSHQQLSTKKYKNNHIERNNKTNKILDKQQQHCKVNNDKSNNNCVEIPQQPSSLLSSTTIISKTNNNNNINININSNSDSATTQILKSYQKFNIDNNDDVIKKLSPSFDSWTSFTFTKNFISNVFC